MKKILTLSLSLILTIVLLTSCGTATSSNDSASQESAMISSVVSIISNSASEAKEDSAAASEIAEATDDGTENEDQMTKSQSSPTMAESKETENNSQMTASQSKSTIIENEDIKGEDIESDNIENENAESEKTALENENDQSNSNVSDSEDNIDDPSWDELESLGKIQTEQGILFVKITLPADFVETDITQESIDANAGETYTSGILNEDGSVTYTLTKKQHKEMLDSITKGMEEGFQEIIDDPEIAISKIDYNEDMTTFDVYLSTEELGLTETYMAFAFYMYGGIYSLFSGHDDQNITVNYYSPSGELISTGNSSELDW